ncbi:MAG: hypothetical protein ACJASV_001036 [Pseudorhodobacter sp.]|jgi:hypothetical protein
MVCKFFNTDEFVSFFSLVFKVEEDTRRVMSCLLLPPLFAEV